MSRRKNRNPGGTPQTHQTRSFEQLVADATLNKFGGYIDEQIEQAAQAILIRQQRAMTAVFTRIVSIEEILLETVPGLTKDQLAARVADVTDRNEGFTAVDEAVSVGDRVRVEIKTKTADQAEYQGSSRMQIDQTGSGNTLGAELESALIGMKAGETREVMFGKDHSLQASLHVSKVSRQPVAAEEAAPAETTEAAPTEAPQAEEAADANSNAG